MICRAFEARAVGGALVAIRNDVLAFLTLALPWNQIIRARKAGFTVRRTFLAVGNQIVTFLTFSIF